MSTGLQNRKIITHGVDRNGQLREETDYCVTEQGQPFLLHKARKKANYIDKWCKFVKYFYVQLT